ncbi:hypothetical protein RRF57_001302 [Xylaria bambusicola]|uniref:Carrier domain-containing protein n=1 Tax=Xylaria bambusicola TaxID=326684 RepID=A0AAN7UHC9_9PEZI
MDRDARFTGLKWRETGADSRKDASVGAQDKTHTLAYKLASAQSRKDAAEVIGQTIATKFATIFMLSANDIDLRQSLTQYGVDSLVAVELRNMLLLQAGADVSIFNVMQSSSLAALALDVAIKSKYLSAEAKAL